MSQRYRVTCFDPKSGLSRELLLVAQDETAVMALVQQSGMLVMNIVPEGGGPPSPPVAPAPVAPVPAVPVQAVPVAPAPAQAIPVQAIPVQAIPVPAVPPVSPPPKAPQSRASIPAKPVVPPVAEPVLPVTKIIPPVKSAVPVAPRPVASAPVSAVPVVAPVVKAPVPVAPVVPPPVVPIPVPEGPVAAIRVTTVPATAIPLPVPPLPVQAIPVPVAPVPVQAIPVPVAPVLVQPVPVQAIPIPVQAIPVQPITAQPVPVTKAMPALEAETPPLSFGVPLAGEGTGLKRKKAKRKSPFTPEGEIVINVVPMLDMTFQLLFFFIITFQSPEGIEAQIPLTLPPPEGKQEASKDKKDKPDTDMAPTIDSDVMVEIKSLNNPQYPGEMGEVEVAGLTKEVIRPTTGKSLEEGRTEVMERLGAVMTQMAADLKKDKMSIRLKSDPGVKWERVIQVADVCRKAKFLGIRFEKPGGS